MAAQIPGGFPAFSLGRSPPCQSAPGHFVAHFGNPPTCGSQPASLPFPRGRIPQLLWPGGLPRGARESRLLPPLAALLVATPSPPRALLVVRLSSPRHPSIPLLHLLIASTTGCLRLDPVPPAPTKLTVPAQSTHHCSVTAPAWSPCLVPRSGEPFLSPPQI